MTYQWYPGHMTKAIRMMKENLSLVDLVIELTDARIPLAGRNPDIDSLSEKKERLLLLNKADLADARETDRWRAYFEKRGLLCHEINSKSGEGIKELRRLIDVRMREKKERDRQRGIGGRPIRAMVAGIPNVGKSSLINRLKGSAAAKAANKPGVTKGKQWIMLDQGLQLLDTPGLLWPRFEDQEVGELLSYIGSMKDDNLDLTDLSLKLITRLRKSYPGYMETCYDIRDEQVRGEEAMALTEGMLMEDAEVRYSLPYLYAMARNRNLKAGGGVPDVDRMARQLLDDFRMGKIGHITLQRVEEYIPL